jgi:hypothetical protein
MTTSITITNNGAYVDYDENGELIVSETEPKAMNLVKVVNGEEVLITTIQIGTGFLTTVEEGEQLKLIPSGV